MEGEETYERTPSEALQEIKEAISVAEEFMTLVKELAWEDFTKHFDNLEEASAETMDVSEPAYEGTYKVTSSGYELDRADRCVATIYLRGEAGKIKEYHLWMSTELGATSAFVFIDDPDTPLDLEDRFKIMDQAINHGGRRTVKYFRSALENTKQMAADERLEKVENES